MIGFIKEKQVNIIKKYLVIIWILYASILFANEDSVIDSTSNSHNNYKILENVELENCTRAQDVRLFDFIDKSLIGLIRFYKEYISDVDDHSCQILPVCSTYNLKSIDKYGFVIGVLKISDRLHRCGHDFKYYECVSYNNKIGFGYRDSFEK